MTSKIIETLILFLVPTYLVGQSPIDWIIGLQKDTLWGQIEKIEENSIVYFESASQTFSKIPINEVHSYRSGSIQKIIKKYKNQVLQFKAINTGDLQIGVVGKFILFSKSNGDYRIVERPVKNARVISHAHERLLERLFNDCFLEIRGLSYSRSDLEMVLALYHECKEKSYKLL